ncbi:MAG: radical SAM protein [Treponema sp.]|nr:radical SAM protein [Treponema sp.]
MSPKNRIFVCGGVYAAGKTGSEAVMAGLRKVRAIIKWLVPDGLLYRYIVPFYKKITRSSQKKRKQLRFQINIVDHCNLNCRGCTAFSPIAKEKYIDVSIFERDCIRLSELTGGQIELIDLLGGEPLLHPEIITIIKIARKYFHTGDINIVTNGILLKKMPGGFWRACHENNIIVIISGYPIKLDIDGIKAMAEKNNVRLTIRGNTSDIKIWNKVPFDVEGRQNVVENFRTCYGANFCVNLEDGKLATCPIPFVIKHFNKYFNQQVAVTERDYIDIFKVKNIGEIFDFLRRPAPICAFCNLKGITYGIDWAVSKKEITEWI